MVGRLSTYAKNRILNLRFQKNFKIKHIAQILLSEDNIKVSRESISTFLKKYIETKSIDDKPRSGRNKKLTAEEINLIGEVTRLNRDITAPKIKQYLNLNVSTHTILRASKLFEWNKLNPNSNEAKKAAALERQLNGETKSRFKSNRKKKHSELEDQENNDQFTSTDSQNSTIDSTNQTDSDYHSEDTKKISTQHDDSSNYTKLPDSCDLKLVCQTDILTFKNISSSPMVFATKILTKIFRLDELIGHNVSGKTFNKYIKNKKPLDEKRINYIRWLIENNFDPGNNPEHLWKMCRTAINKIILINEKKAARTSQLDTSNLEYTNELDYEQSPVHTTIVRLDDEILDEASLEPPKTNPKSRNKLKRYYVEESETAEDTTYAEDNSQNLIEDPTDLDDSYNLDLMSEKDIMLIKNLYCSPMIFSTKIMTRIYGEEELIGRNLTGKTFHKNKKIKQQIDETRLMYIKWLVFKYFDTFKNKSQLWQSCCKAMSRVLRNLDKKAELDALQTDPDNLESEDPNESIKLEKNHTVVVLFDDPEQERQILLEQNEEKDFVAMTSAQLSTV